MKPLCFVLMPFGTKKDATEKEINFDVVYQSFIKPAIIAAGLDPIRADEEQGGGFIHKPMYERLMFCDFAVADLSFANANVFYELGIRHALKPHTTVSIFETNTKLPFDSAPLRTFPYDFKDGAVASLEQKVEGLCKMIRANVNTTKAQQDSPIAQLITGYKFPDLDYLEEDAEAFKDWVVSANTTKEQMNVVVKQWKQLNKSKEKKGISTEEKAKVLESQGELVKKIRQIEEELGDTLAYNYDLLYALLSAYKSVNSFADITRMLKPLVEGPFKDNIFIKQQLGLAYNKTKEREEAERILKTITDQYGPDPETNGLLGAAYKGMMDDNDGETGEASFRRKAIKAYLDGFEADPRDYYPGVNALTLMFLGNTNKEDFTKYFPLVQFAVDRQVKKKPDDYWLQATRLELAVLGNNAEEAAQAFDEAWACNPDDWARDSTRGNLNKLYKKKLETIDETELKWLKQFIDKL
jgi:hypothetical protein